MNVSFKNVYLIALLKEQVKTFLIRNIPVKSAVNWHASCFFVLRSINQSVCLSACLIYLSVTKGQALY